MARSSSTSFSCVPCIRIYSTICRIFPGARVGFRIRSELLCFGIQLPKEALDSGPRLGLREAEGKGEARKLALAPPVWIVFSLRTIRKRVSVRKNVALRPESVTGKKTASAAGACVWYRYVLRRIATSSMRTAAGSLLQNQTKRNGQHQGI